MLNVLIRAIILYFFLLAAMRLMGKRQLSEFQPFEFAITLVAADLACIPMSDNTIPIIYGIIPIFTLVILHNLLTFFAIKSHRFRKLINGKPVILIGDGKIDCDVLKKCGMTANDPGKPARTRIFQNRRDKLRRAGNKRESIRAAKVCKRAGNERRP